MILEGKNIRLSINQVDILKGVDFEVQTGELVGLIGPNGAGKSSLVKSVCGINPSSQGEVFYKGQALEQISKNQQAKDIAYLGQNSQAHWPLSVEKVVSLGRLPYQGWWQKPSAEDIKAVQQAMEKTEIIAYKNRQATSLSGGEQTLVMLARIFATQAKLILADEPIAALDPYHQLHVMELLREHAQQDRAAVVVLHDLSMAAKYCDRIYMMSHGEVYAHGSPDQVLSEANIEKVYGVRSKIHCDNDAVSIALVKRESEFHP